MQSKYLETFKKIATSPFRGNRVVVEVLPKEELKSAGGIILPAAKTHRNTAEDDRAELALVLLPGSGYAADDGTDVPLDLAPGNVILVSKLAFKYYSEFPGLANYTENAIALIRETEVHAKWDSIEAYEAYKQQLNS
jgi:co-chaperonin GroES (HSP10)